MYRTLRNSLPAVVASATVCFLLSGCALSSGTTAAAPVVPVGTLVSTPLAGTAFGGQQPVVGATVGMYAAGTTGYGTGSSSLIGGQTITTNSNGGFSIPTYTCPSPTSEVYLTASGGSSATGQAANPNIANIVALGPCGTLASVYKHININELTTVSAVYALSGFITGNNIGTSPTNLVGLTNAFSSAAILVNPQYGQVPGPALPPGAIMPTSEVNTLADILAACVNTAGSHTAGDGSTCGTLFEDAPNASGVFPTNTAEAAVNIAQNPTENVAALNALANTMSPFQPILTSSPTSWTMAITYNANGALSNPVGIAADQSGNVWVANIKTSVVELSPTGTPLVTTTSGGGAYGPLAIDLSGNAWAASNSTGTIVKVSSAGAVSSFIGGGLPASPLSIAVDGGNNVWVSGPDGTLSAFNNSGTPLSASGYTGGGLTDGFSLAITYH